ncbi:MAG: hypothetical protein ACRD44_17510, partial [Bryobacteraceae bacterium]
DDALKEYILLRSVDSPKLAPLAGSEGALRPFWSPDGRYLAFFTRDGKLKKIDVAGGFPPVVLCDAPAAGSGGAWNSEGVIVFASNGKLHRVSASGGKPEQLPSPDGERRRYPQFLPDGRRFVYFAGQPGATGIYAGSPDSREGSRIGDSSDPGLFVSPNGSGRGYLLFSRGDTILAQPFDAGSKRLSGEPIPVADRLYVGTGLSYGGFSATGGVLAYRSASVEGGQIVWLDREGDVVEAVGPRGVFGDPHLSPDNRRIAFTATQPRANPDVWVHDLVRGVRERFTVNAAPDEAPVWSPDGKAIAFASRREMHQLLIKEVAGASGERILLTADGISPTDWSPDGRFILYVNIDPKTNSDLWLLPMQGDRTPLPLARSPFNERHGRISPDGRWVAYSSDESGTAQIYVQAFRPGAGTAPRYQVSSGGGAMPRWRADSRELYYLAGDGRLFAVSIRRGPSFAASAPTPLFDTRLRGAFSYSVDSAGKRFLFVRGAEDGEVPVLVVLNWPATLRRK